MRASIWVALSTLVACGGSTPTVRTVAAAAHEHENVVRGLVVEISPALGTSEVVLEISAGTLDAAEPQIATLAMLWAQAKLRASDIDVTSEILPLATLFRFSISEDDDRTRASLRTLIRSLFLWSDSSAADEDYPSVLLEWQMRQAQQLARGERVAQRLALAGLVHGTASDALAGDSVTSEQVWSFLRARYRPSGARMQIRGAPEGTAWLEWIGSELADVATADAAEETNVSCDAIALRDASPGPVRGYAATAQFAVAEFDPWPDADGVAWGSGVIRTLAELSALGLLRRASSARLRTGATASSLQARRMHAYSRTCATTSTRQTVVAHTHPEYEVDAAVEPSLARLSAWLSGEVVAVRTHATDESTVEYSIRIGVVGDEVAYGWPPSIALADACARESDVRMERSVLGFSVRLLIHAQANNFANSLHELASCIRDRGSRAPRASVVRPLWLQTLAPNLQVLGALSRSVSQRQEMTIDENTIVRSIDANIWLGSVANESRGQERDAATLLATYLAGDAVFATPSPVSRTVEPVPRPTLRYFSAGRESEPEVVEFAFVHTPMTVRAQTILAAELQSFIANVGADALPVEQAHLLASQPLQVTVLCVRGLPVVHLREVSNALFEYVQARVSALHATVVDAVVVRAGDGQ